MPVHHNVLNKRIMFMIIMVTVIFVAISFKNISDDRKLTIASAERQASGLASTFYDHAAHAFGHAEDTLNLITKILLATDSSSNNSQKQINDTLTDFSKSYALNHPYFIISANNSIIASSREFTGKQPDISNLEFFRYHTQNQDLDAFIGAPTNELIKGKWLITITRRINNPDGSLRYITGVAIDPAYFRRAYKQIEIGEKDRILLIRLDGTPLAEEDLYNTNYKVNLLNSPLYKAGLISNRANNIYSGTFENLASIIDNSNRLVSYRSAADSKLITIVSINRDELLAPWNKRTKNHVYSLILFVSLVAILCYLIQRQIRKIKQSESKYRMLFENSADAILIHDMNAKMLAANHMACEQLGYSRSELMSMPVASLEATTGENTIQDRLTHVNHIISTAFETVLKRSDGSTLNAEVSARQIYWNEQPAIMNICRDITERKKNEEKRARLSEQLRQAHKMEAIGILAGGMAHDFNNLLQSILGYTCLAKMSTETGSATHEYLEAAENI